MSHDKFDTHLTSLTASKLLNNLDSQKNNDVKRPSNEKSRDDVTLKSPNVCWWHAKESSLTGFVQAETCQLDSVSLSIGLFGGGGGGGDSVDAQIVGVFWHSIFV